MDVSSLFCFYKSWLKYNFPNTTSDQQLKGIMEELGELVHHDLKMEQGIRNSSLKDIKDSIGDIFMYLMGYCAEKDINIAECIFISWEEIKGRDWRRYPTNGKTE